MNKELPKNTDTEKAIFSVILMNPEGFIEIADKLEPRDFYHIRHQEIWRAMGSLYQKGQDIDIVSVKTELEKQDVDYKPALEVLSSCYDSPVLGGNLLAFVKEVKNKSLLRQIVGTALKHKQEAHLEDADALSILTRIEKDVVDLSDQVKDGRPVDAGGILDEVRADISKSQHGGWRSFNTGFYRLDEESGGLIPTQCMIIGAYTGVGKTFFILQIILNILKQGAKVMLFSTEMDRKMNMLRMLGMLAGLGTINILKGRLDDDEKERLEYAEKALGAYKQNLIIYDNVYTVGEIRLKAKKKKLRDGLDVVIVDFIQNLRGELSIYERMSNAAIGLQQIAQELGITMVLASQVTQASADWAKKEVIGYKGAGEIAAVADVGLWIKRVEDDLQARRIVLRKMRHGRSNKSFDVRVLFPSGRVIDIDKEENGQQDA